MTDGSREGDAATEIVVDAGGGYGLVVDGRRRLRQTGFSPVVAEHVASLDRSVPVALYPPAYPAFDEEPHAAPALRVTHASGVVSTRLRVAGHDRRSVPSGEEHRIDLVDESEPLTVTLGFRTWPDHGVLEQWVELENRQGGPVTLHELASAAPLLLAPEARLTHFPGAWATEWTACDERLTPGTKMVESRGGVRPHLFLAPFVLLEPEGTTTEDGGVVLAGGLAWGGDVRFAFSRDLEGRIRVLAGHNPASGPYVLDPGDRFVAPRMVWAWSTTGRGPLSRRLHRWVRDHVVRDGHRRRAVVANNWEATSFDFDERKVLALMDGAREVGADLFLLDDGWFGSPEHPRDADDAGLGDWQVDHRKLPGGLEALTEGAGARSLRFGLWIEPEMVNPRSRLFAAHPDWVVGQPGRTGREERQQLVLDLCRPEVRAFVVDTVDRLLTEHPGISYLKWDANRAITEPGSGALPADRQANLWVDWTRWMGEVMAEVARRHPEVEMMLCASGGGRVDLSTLRWFHEFWLSDNTDPVIRLRMQWAASHLLPALAMGGHVTGWGDRPLPFACAVAMGVRFGFDVDTTALSSAELAVCRRATTTYHRVADLVQHGDLHRLVAPVPGPGERAALAYVAPDRRRAVVFAYQVADLSPGAPAARLRLTALDPDQIYRVRSIDLGAPDPGAPDLGAGDVVEDEPVDDRPGGGGGGSVERQGEVLVADGLAWPLSRALTAAIWELDAAPGDAPPTDGGALASAWAGPVGPVGPVVRGSPAPQVDRPDLDHLVAVDDEHALVERDGGIDVGGQDAHLVADPDGPVLTGAERDVLVGDEPAVTRVDDLRVPVVHAQRLEPGVEHGPPRRVHRDDRRPQPERVPEGRRVRHVLAVHERVRPGLDLGGPSVDVVGAGAAGRHDLAADLGVGREEQAHGGPDEIGLRLDGLAHEVALVAHDPSHLETPAPGECGDATRVDRGAAATGEAHVDIDENLAHTPGCGGVDGLGRVDGDGHPGGAGLDDASQTGAVEHLVGEQQVLAQIGGRHALDLVDGGAAEPAVPGRRELAGERGGLERLDVRAQAGAREGVGHRGHVVVERRAVDQQRRGRDVGELHGAGT